MVFPERFAVPPLSMRGVPQMSRVNAYSPMGQRVCTTTPEQMAEKLQRRVKEVEERRGTQTDGRDQQSPGGLVWASKAPGAQHVDEATGRYRISGAKVGDKHRYSAWRRPVITGGMADPLGCTDTPDEAKQLCASHAAAEAKQVK